MTRWKTAGRRGGEEGGRGNDGDGGESVAEGGKAKVRVKLRSEARVYGGKGGSAQEENGGGRATSEAECRRRMVKS